MKKKIKKKYVTGKPCGHKGWATFFIAEAPNDDVRPVCGLCLKQELDEYKKHVCAYRQCGLAGSGMVSDQMGNLYKIHNGSK